MIRPGVRPLLRLRERRHEALLRELDDEIRGHLEERARGLEAAGWSPGEARAEALRRFGPLPAARRELLRAARRRERLLALRQALDELRQDLRHALRSVRREPGFTAVVVVVIALGVGANAAMFGVLDRLLLRGPEHVVEPERLARVYTTAAHPGGGEFTGDTLGYVAYEVLRDRVPAYAGAAAYSAGDATLGEGPGAEPVRAGHATADLFPLLGVRPLVGRFFDGEDDRPGAARPLAVLGHRLWRDRFAADAGVLGSVVAVDGRAYEVVGVAPRGFTGVELERVDVWLPMSLRGARIAEDWRTTWHVQWLKVVVRRKPGIAPAVADEAATTAWRAAYAGDEEPLETATLHGRPVGFDHTGEEALEVAVTRWLAGVSLVVLLVAGANVANLMLARALRRQREIAVRLALGVSRGRLTRLLLVESLALALLGGAAALVVAPLVAGLVRGTLLPQVEWSGPVVDARVLTVAGTLTLLCGVLTGLAPVLQARRRGGPDALKEGPRGSGPGSSRLRGGLAVAQAAFSLLLLIGAGLFVRSLWNAHALDLGIEPERVLTIAASWRPAPDEPEEARAARRDAFYRAALERVRRRARVEAAAISVGTPFHSRFQQRVRVPGRAELPRLPGGGPFVQAVSAGYFSTAGIERRAGRAFTAVDRAGSEPVAVVNHTLAETLWPEEGALERCLHVGPDPAPCARVVGVVEDARRLELVEEPAMQVYLPLGQEREMAGSTLLVRPAGDPTSLLEPLRRELAALDPGILWLDVARLSDRLDPFLRPWRLGASLVGVFGALALAIAAIGLYSLTAYAVANRTHEIGVRMALGARRGAVLRLVMRRGMGLAVAGCALGALLASLAAPSLGALLFQASPRDPVVYAAAAAALLGAATLACVVPALAAARLAPVEALRDG